MDQFNVLDWTKDICSYPEQDLLYFMDICLFPSVANRQSTLLCSLCEMEKITAIL